MSASWNAELEGRRGGKGREEEQDSEGGGDRGEQESGINTTLIQSRPSEGPNWMLHVACNEIQH